MLQSNLICILCYVYLLRKIAVTLLDSVAGKVSLGIMLHRPFGSVGRDSR